jgi:hypothetical protein
MRDTYTSENHRDFNARYAYTFGWLVQGDKQSLVHLQEGDEECFKFTKGTTQTYTAYIDGGAIFEFIPIKMGWFNANDGHIIFLERHPARQWKRGICTENTWAYIHTPWGIVAERVSYQLLESIFVNPIKVDKELILNKVNASLPVALSQHFAVANRAVYLYKTIIATIDNNVITMRNDIVKQELSDCIRRLGLDWSIKSE